MKKIAIIMGSDSDLPVVKPAIDKLKSFGVPVEAHVMSAHRTPALASEFAANAKANGFGVIIAAAGKAGVAGLLHCRGLACLFLGHVDDAVGLNFHLRQLPRVLRREKVRKGSLCILALGDTAVDPVDQQNDRQRDQQRGADAAFWAVSAGFSPVVVIVIIVGGVIAIQVHSLASFITLALS